MEKIKKETSAMQPGRLRTDIEPFRMAGAVPHGCLVIAAFERPVRPGDAEAVRNPGQHDQEDVKVIRVLVQQQTTMAYYEGAVGIPYKEMVGRVAARMLGKLGRKKEARPVGRQHQLYIFDAHYLALKEFGKGNASLGLRVLVEKSLQACEAQKEDAVG